MCIHCVVWNHQPVIILGLPLWPENRFKRHSLHGGLLTACPQLTLPMRPWCPQASACRLQEICCAMDGRGKKKTVDLVSSHFPWHILACFHGTEAGNIILALVILDNSGSRSFFAWNKMNHSGLASCSKGMGWAESTEYLESRQRQHHPIDRSLKWEETNGFVQPNCYWNTLVSCDCHG